MQTTFEQPRGSKSNWWNNLIAVIAVINLLLVLFDFSYIPLRDVYLKYIPAITIYDSVKSIEPHPVTQRYLNTVDLLETHLQKNRLQANSSASIFASLRQQSIDILTENPFLSANKFSTFATLNRRIEYQMDTLSARKSFTEFWSQDYFHQVGIEEALSFFDSKIRPLLEVNYYRVIDENGKFIDKFWFIDIGFVSFFVIELLARTFWVSRQQNNVSWWDAILRNWYDGLFLLPKWQWLRVVPVAVKLHKSSLVNTERILAQITHEPAAYLANRASMFLMVRLINQTQEAVESGDAVRSLFKPKAYLKVGEVDNFDEITDRILKLVIYRVLPEIQPDVEVFLQHSLKSALKESDFYQVLQNVPGIEMIPTELSEQLADYIAEATYEILASSYADTQGRLLFENLTQNFRVALRQQLQDEKLQQELQPLISDLLEELKLNYVQRAKQENPEATLDEAMEIGEQC
ncbi:MAG: hypothetical protein AAFQ91_19560 [Cyanobacteria bacterium J06621_15]